MRPFNTAADRNKDAILPHLRTTFANCRRILEIGSGTGQHAVHFAAALPHLSWQPSDIADKLDGMELWLSEASLPNVLPPLTLDVTRPLPPLPGYRDDGAFDGIYTANTLHIVPETTVQAFFQRVGEVLAPGGRCVVYGPFKYGGRFTTPSNEAFHAQLRAWNPMNGIRDFEWVDELARAQDLRLIDDHAMPANNQLLVWERGAVPSG
ncbi:hypothetical protein GCM10011316_28350 [Roseibium aquae]|uniref:DUF938 domain-containing protein n=1 Tax=Roseibium aquae TaxID=1323746 RepID=A0A916TMA8_9HYPH|nr:DUF938 domain-containing protein [Roseibium aquae]GGB54627.1 hypothetical protein GCM10011316_28350 [Roseibium aquae]